MSSAYEIIHRAARVALALERARAFGRVLGLGLVLAGTILAAVATPARANEIARSEGLGCANGSCMDSFEVRCRQASAFLCIDFVGKESDPTTFSIAAVATVPTAMLGTTQRKQVWHDATATVCFARPGAEGAMRALVTVAAYNDGVAGSPIRSYELRAECHRSFNHNLATRDTSIARLQNE
jgi:hypothetical protein